jgi:hypothetical protein
MSKLAQQATYKIYTEWLLFKQVQGIKKILEETLKD